MPKTKTSWTKGQSGNPSGRPREGEGIVKTLAAELKRRGQSKKLSKIIIKRALLKDADWRLQTWIFDYFYKLYQHEDDMYILDKINALETKLNEVLNEIDNSSGK